MKNIYLSLISILLFLACCKDDDASGGNGDPIVPECVESLYMPGPSQDTFLQTVRKVKINDAYHFWLNNDFMAFDGEEFIIDENCDTVCFFCGFCGPPECDSLYDNADWEIIWEK